MSEMVQLTIDNKQYEAREGSLLIDTLLDNKIHIQHFCYHPSLGTDGNCRMCMVEIEGQKRPQISCDTPVKKDMIVYTQGEKISAVQRDILELELVNHPLDCPTCDQAGECKLQEFYMSNGLHVSRVGVPKNNALKKVDLGANVILDQERCVLCTLCVRFTQQYPKTGELGVINRADHAVIDTFPGLKLHNPYAMNIIDLCPVGALTSKDFRFKQRVFFLESFDAICNGCSRGCNIAVDHRKEKYKDDMIYRFRPRKNLDVNGYFICDEGRLSYTKENEQRFLTPQLNQKETHLHKVQTAMIQSLQQATSVLFLISPHLSLEEMNTIKKFAHNINASTSGYAPQYFDPTFEDDILKRSDRSPNRASYKECNINEEKNHFKEKFNQASLIVIIENNYFENHQDLLKDKNIITLFSQQSSTIQQANIAIPIASFLEKSGTYINYTGKRQTVTSKMNKNNPSIDINTLFDSINNQYSKVQ